ncbi:MAG: hypothetical protein ACM3UL_04805 [Ignavibacteria bacterium]
MTTFSKDDKKGVFVIEEKKKKREIIREAKKQADIPTDVGDEKKKALDQTGDDATSGW